MQGIYLVCVWLRTQLATFSWITFLDDLTGFSGYNRIMVQHTSWWNCSWYRLDDHELEHFEIEFFFCTPRYVRSRTTYLVCTFVRTSTIIVLLTCRKQQCIAICSERSPGEAKLRTNDKWSDSKIRYSAQPPSLIQFYFAQQLGVISWHRIAPPFKALSLDLSLTMRLYLAYAVGTCWIRSTLYNNTLAYSVVGKIYW